MAAFTLQSGEHIVRRFKQSKAVLLKSSGLTLLVIIVLWRFVLYYELGQFQSIAVLISVGIVSYFLHTYRLWSLQTYTITNKRLIKQQHQSIFKKVVLETPLERILNISYKTTGLFSVLFVYGDVEVQVVGLIEPIILTNATHPSKLKDFLWQVHGQALQHSGSDVVHLQERIGYTKENQRIL